MSSIRDRSRGRVLTALREHGLLSQAEIARASGLSRATVSELLAELRARGLVEAVATPQAAQPGRPATRLALGRPAGHVLGVDFGHSHVGVAVATLAHDVLAEREERLPFECPAEQALQAASRLALAVEDEVGVSPHHVIAAGVGVPAPLDRGRVASAQILRGWDGLPIAEEMSRRLGVPAQIDNDANLGALAELVEGAGRGARNFVYVKASTGIGAGLVIGGEVHRGNLGSAGAIGHTSVDPDGPVCYCGSRGCLETFAGGPAIVDALKRTHGDSLTLDEVVRLAVAGDPASRRVLGDAGRRIGSALARACNLLDPELVVVGGVLAEAGDIVLDPVREEILRWTIPAIGQAVAVRTAELGRRAELVGAVGLVLRTPDRAIAARIHGFLEAAADRWEEAAVATASPPVPAP